ncbi:DUF6884 domain-containing protein [Cohnella nanjingensis]|uniref:DUF6884 domain-containing protein n=1 Tax=Cohnella nanjingensis TaxID=1387779 RepID=A0A7X0RM99_9BACL|nr:DUF6884 domain-containing protein [Cohnella nanjingensis]MBB6670055.1 hypothetical protein [Cohnella nanjingensis]
MRQVALISCTKVKQEFPCEVREMYSKSQLFSKMVRYIESKQYSDWYVLSAQYGLLHKNQVIEPYDVTLNNMNSSDRKKWAKETASQVIDLDFSTVDIYAGEKYRQFLIPLLEARGLKCKVPLRGLGIGEQLKYLNNGLY